MGCDYATLEGHGSTLWRAVILRASLVSRVLVCYDSPQPARESKVKHGERVSVCPRSPVLYAVDGRERRVLSRPVAIS